MRDVSLVLRQSDLGQADLIYLELGTTHSVSACFHYAQTSQLCTQRSPGCSVGRLVLLSLVKVSPCWRGGWGGLRGLRGVLWSARQLPTTPLPHCHHQYNVGDDDCGNFNQQEKVVVTIVDGADSRQDSRCGIRPTLYVPVIIIIMIAVASYHHT